MIRAVTEICDANKTKREQAQAEGPDMGLGERQRLLRDSTRRLQISKILTVGDGRAGKTCLLRALRDEDFNPEQESTCGVQEVKVKVKEQSWEATEGTGLSILALPPHPEA